MPNTKPWREIRETQSKLTLEKREEIDRNVRSETAKMKLGELRRARRLSQAQIAASLGLNQGDVSKIERRTELYVSTLRRFIEAVGGDLEIIARFPDVAPIALDFLTDNISDQPKLRVKVKRKPSKTLNNKVAHGHRRRDAVGKSVKSEKALA